jgi:hypothetical protein
MFPIESITVGAGGASSLTFTSIPQTFTHLQLRVFGVAPSANTNYFTTINSSGFGNYARHELRGNGSSATSGGVASDAPIIYYTSGTASTSFPFVSVVDILDYTNTNKYKVARTLSGRDENGSGLLGLYSWLWTNTSAITTLSVDSFSAGQFSQYSRADLYGISTSNATGA